MQQTHSNSIRAALSSKRDLLKGALFAIFAALAVGTLASAIVTMGAAYLIPISILCISVIIITLIVLLRELLETLAFSDEIRASLVFDQASASLIPVKGYKYTKEFANIISAVETENKAIHADWTKQPLVETSGTKKEKLQEKDAVEWYAICKVNRSATKPERKSSENFVEEVSSFIVLEQLSLHLQSYFGSADDSPHLVEMIRDDIPEFLLKNRILNLLSTPIEQREIFLDAFPDPDNRPDGEIHGLFGSNGAIYQRFDLILPLNSKIKDIGAQGFEIETPRFVLQVRVKFRGTRGVVSREFCDFYLRRSFEDVLPLDVIVNVTGRIKPLSLLNSKGWEFHNWLDSFRGRLRSNLDFESFLENISWRQVEPLLFATRTRPARSSPPRVKGAQADEAAAGTAEGS